eukprot:Plantae.Rhodophyta-Hildenbrandia_rubra.ctg16398.p1 GENE.Plantae.Rhodophyta-Hildenbrandia_rubra.ctg16398~~Plantae.Rhodophyta-Hildenbrandia_rubra.ctg16398.p1  ORF type:complete len:242 (+),score=64.29 Plantae.Rhodophyta-Hildenbrandia_rubra.ctg16398:240-965(+)
MDPETILARLDNIEKSQRQFAADVTSRHEQELSEVRAGIENAKNARKSAELEASRAVLPPAPPVLMEVNMTEIEAAVQAAAASAEESERLRDEAKVVAEQAKLASGVIPGSNGVALIKGGEVGFGPDNEYIVKKVSVNLDDVEKAINSSPVVEMCKAFGRPDAKYGNEVYCAVVPKRNVRVSEPMLMIYAQKYLPTAMVPKRFFFLEDLPPGITRKALAETSISDLGRKKGLRKALPGVPQ